MDTYIILQVSHGEYESFQQITFFLNTFLKTVATVSWKIS